MPNRPRTRLGHPRQSTTSPSPERITLRRRITLGGLVLDPGTILEGRWNSVSAGCRGFAGWDVEVAGRHLAIEDGVAERVVDSPPTSGRPPVGRGSRR